MECISSRGSRPCCTQGGKEKGDSSRREWHAALKGLLREQHRQATSWMRAYYHNYIIRYGSLPPQVSAHPTGLRNPLSPRCLARAFINSRARWQRRKSVLSAHLGRTALKLASGRVFVPSPPRGTSVLLVGVWLSDAGGDGQTDRERGYKRGDRTHKQKDVGSPMKAGAKGERHIRRDT